MSLVPLTGDYILTADRASQDANLGTIRMYPSATYVQPLALTPDMVDIRDVIHHLSHINRFTGGTPKPYSVLQHSYIVASYFRSRSREIRLAALFHDAEEAYLNDIASPVKRHPDLFAYVNAGERARGAIFAKLGVDPLLVDAVVKPIDDLVFHREVASFFADVRPVDAIKPRAPEFVRALFIQEYQDITGETIPAWRTA